MRKAIKDQWLAALRSGRYPQADGSLHTKDGYCCLGVLCDLAPSTVGRWSDLGIGMFAYRFVDPEHDESQKTQLTSRVRDYAGLDDVDPQVVFPEDDPLLLEAERRIKAKRPDRRFYLSDLNDTGFTFAEIADIIEKYISVDNEEAAA